MKWTKRDCLLIVQHMYFFPRYIITFASTSSTSVFQCIEAYFLNWITSIFCNEITWQYRYNYQLPHERGFFVLFCFLLLHLYSNTDKKLKNDFMNFVVKRLKTRALCCYTLRLSLHFQSLLTWERTITKIEIKVWRLDYWWGGGVYDFQLLNIFFFSNGW